MASEAIWKWLVDGPPDPRGSQFPIIRGGIASSVPILVCLFVLIHIILPLWMQKRPPIDMRPVMLIFSGLLYGISGGGLMIGVSLTNWGRETMKCDRTHDEMKDYIIAYCGFAFFILKFVDFLKIVFATLRKNNGQPSIMNFLQTSLLILMVQSGMYFHPGGIAYFIGVVDTFVGFFINTYYILGTAKCFQNRIVWKIRLTRLQAASYAALLLHALYFAVDPGCKGPKLFLCMQALYGGTSLFFFTLIKRRYLLPASRKQYSTIKSN